jgi:hypothetical protein
LGALLSVYIISENARGRRVCILQQLRRLIKPSLSDGIIAHAIHFRGAHIAFVRNPEAERSAMA